jgi:hypothetical protein
MLPTYQQDYAAPCDEALMIDVSTANAVLGTPARLLYVGVAGDVTVDMERSGVAIKFASLSVGFHKLRFTKVYTGAGTTATGLVALW